MSEPCRERGLRELESALAALAPAPARIDRDRVLFRAGQRNVASRVRLWQGTAAMCALLGAGLTVTWALQPRPAAEIRVVRVEVPLPVPAPEESAPIPVQPPGPSVVPAVGGDAADAKIMLAYLHLQQQVMRFGPDAIPSRATATAPVGPPRTDLTVPRGSGDRPRIL